MGKWLEIDPWLKTVAGINEMKGGSKNRTAWELEMVGAGFLGRFSLFYLAEGL
jgi:hypothetical protein